jgi:hypothetical protein
MNSKNLIEVGFSEWFPMKTLAVSNLPSDKGAVIIIVDKELSGKPESDILYIGRTKKPTKRIIGGYLGGYGGKTTKKISQMLFNDAYIEKATISWVLTDKPRVMQEQLLAKYTEEHGKFPIWNSKKKLSVKSKKTPVLKRKKTQLSKAKAVAPKAKPHAKPGPKPKSVTAKKPAAKAETSKMEMPNKERTDAETSEKPVPSSTEMTT